MQSALPLAGAGLLRLLGAWRTPRGLVRTLGVAYLGGIAGVGVTLQLVLVLGAPFERWIVIVVCLALAATGFAARSPGGSSRARRSGVPRYLLPAAVLPRGDRGPDGRRPLVPAPRSVGRVGSVDGEGAVARGVQRPRTPTARVGAVPLVEPGLSAADSRDRGVRLLLHASRRHPGDPHPVLAHLCRLPTRAPPAVAWAGAGGARVAVRARSRTRTGGSDPDSRGARRRSALGSSSRWQGSSPGAGSSSRTRSPSGCSRCSRAAAYATKFEGRIYIGALSVTMIVPSPSPRELVWCRRWPRCSSRSSGSCPGGSGVPPPRRRGTFSTSLGSGSGAGLSTRQQDPD